ncbi:MAG: penicillin acylase family protein [Betaproteobacteria bacterium]|nr:penicillin acylase family protein [Betaproteobacteria bacterium]
MRILVRLAFAALIVAAVLAGAMYFHLRRSLPQETGEARLAGLEKPVEILRDRFGVPHIFAQSLADATRVLGYVHAQDRLWQMEMNRRTAAGRLAEVLGPPALETDRFLRTLGVRRAALANFARLDKQTQQLLESYAEGVNAFLATDPVLPVEFWLTGVKPEPWTPADSLGWIKMMAWDLGGNWRSELLRLRLAKTMPLERIHELLPPYPGEKYPPIVELQRFYQGLEQEGVKLAVNGVNGDSPHFSHLQTRKIGTVPIYGQSEGLGSNNWVVSGKRSATGKPLLANDPHLGLTAPAVWYFAHVKTPEFEAIGATLPGVPAIVLGRNSHFAWGFTNTGPDVQDLYLERLDSAGDYLTPDGPRAFERVDEVIRVKGGEDVRLQVRLSRHGPVISDVSRAAQEAAPRGHVVALQWTALREDDLTMQSALKIASAHDWAGFVGALRDFHAPQQNVVYADTAGNIGFVAAGRVPLRKPGNDLMGLAPAPGWLAKYDWAGFVPFAELPHAYNPASGQVVTANHRVTPPGYAHHITSEWQAPYRAQRIEELLRALPAHNVGSFARIQGDVVSLPARELLPRLLQTRPAGDEARRALRLLGAWDGTMDAERPEPLVFWAWWRELTRALYADEMGEAFRGQWLARAPFVAAVLEDRDGQSRWCDNVRTPAAETCDALLSQSLDAALADLRRRYGGDMASWRWGAAHEARHEHRPFGRVPWLARWFDISVPSAGDAYTVNVGRNRMEDEARPYANTHAASLRAIYDLEDLERSLFIHSGGQSGNVLSRHYRSFSAAWARGDYMPMTTGRAQLEAAGAGRLVLRGNRP